MDGSRNPSFSSSKPATQTRNRELTLQAMGPTSSRKLISAHSSSASGFQLPDDWKVEEPPGRCNPRHLGKELPLHCQHGGRNHFRTPMPSNHGMGMPFVIRRYRFFY